MWDADAEALTHFRDVASELRAENLELRSSQRRAVAEAETLRRENAELLGEGVWVAGSSVPVGAPTAGSARPVQGSTKELPGRDDGILGAVVDFISRAERGEMGHAEANIAVGTSVFLSSVLIVYFIFSQFLAWVWWRQILALALLGSIGAMGWVLTIREHSQGLLIGCTLVIFPAVYCMGSIVDTFHHYYGLDLDKDGDIDWHDRLDAFRRAAQSFEMFYETVLGLMPIVVLGAGGFAVLWYMGVIQPMAQQLCVYGFFAMLLIACLALFVYKIWRNLNTSLMQFFEQFKMFEHKAEDIIQDIPEHVRKVFEEWRIGDRSVSPFEDRALANLRRDPFLTIPDPPGASLADVSGDPFLTADTAERRRVLGMLCEFAEVVLDKFKDINDAYAAFDVNKNGMLTKKEFRDGARQLPQFTGDAMAVFRELDPGSHNGRPSERVTKQAFRRLQDAHEQQAEAKKQLGAAKDALHHATISDVPMSAIFKEPTDSRDRGGPVLALKRALEHARSKAVARAALVEAEHALDEAIEAKNLDEARQSGDRGALQEAIEIAKKKGLPKNRISEATEALKELSRKRGDSRQ